jgi:hypothetical protein
LKQILPDINNFLHDGSTSHEDKMMFWDQRQNQLPKIPKIYGMCHQDRYHRSLDFSIFSFEFDFKHS